MTLKTGLYILVMALCTYLIRMLPMVLFRKKIKSKFVKNLLYYVPYAVLGAMTVPAVFYSTGSIVSACAGLAAALVFAFRNKSLLTVAAAACITAYAASLIMSFLFA